MSGSCPVVGWDVMDMVWVSVTYRTSGNSDIFKQACCHQKYDASIRYV